ncbi:hypothetical protein AtNW77_Chr5g0097831 [Arabidopsis thaliana]
MTVFSGRQVVPMDYEAEVSQRLLEAILDGDFKRHRIALKTRRSEVVLRDESPSEVRVEYEEFKTDVTALFLAVNFGNVALVKELLTQSMENWFPRDFHFAFVFARFCLVV